MVVTNTVLPNGYHPFKTIEICSNKFVHGQVPIMVEGRPLFLFGTGDDVKLWLNLKVGDDKWEYVVSPEEISDSAFSVQRAGRLVALYFGEHLLIQANREGGDHLVINHLDFRPLGISIFGTPKSMQVGGMHLSHNSFKNVYSMVNVT